MPNRKTLQGRRFLCVHSGWKPKVENFFKRNPNIPTRKIFHATSNTSLAHPCPVEPFPTANHTQYLCEGLQSNDTRFFDRVAAGRFPCQAATRISRRAKSRLARPLNSRVKQTLFTPFIQWLISMYPPLMTLPFDVNSKDKTHAPPLHGTQSPLPFVSSLPSSNSHLSYPSSFPFCPVSVTVLY
ncbi:hypothetical protein K443DRAFT_296528 [Laccaria amethystina LaAM-08-1]|uniref:Uncharacterized protein n=1 Tax=Laccaria amethystina LaAM-08-1 TaxID=1095629 RepID=A0A0C9XIN3_9AGAR|nr:hypothetical protein K443DRAFT_296528 [Laccaria amethystina LaAM-08-1]